jgi:hypothetical protein
MRYIRDEVGNIALTVVAARKAQPLGTKFTASHRAAELVPCMTGAVPITP